MSHDRCYWIEEDGLLKRVRSGDNAILDTKPIPLEVIEEEEREK